LSPISNVNKILYELYHLKSKIFTILIVLVSVAILCWLDTGTYAKYTLLFPLVRTRLIFIKYIIAPNIILQKGITLANLGESDIRELL
jgi:hypothetical protein